MYETETASRSCDDPSTDGSCGRISHSPQITEPTTAGPQTFPSSVGPEASEEVAADEPFTLPIISTGTPTPSTAFGGWAMRRRQ